MESRQHRPPGQQPTARLALGAPRGGRPPPCAASSPGSRAPYRACLHVCGPWASKAQKSPAPRPRRTLPPGARAR
eukprot:11175692-Lingulodinium_polyedra.AAC.1